MTKKLTGAEIQKRHLAASKKLYHKYEVRLEKIRKKRDAQVKKLHAKWGKKYRDTVRKKKRKK